MDHARTDNLIARQWRGYPRFHRSRANLLVHIVAVPMFMAANVMFVIALVRGEWVATVVAAVVTGASLFAQGRGHRLEATPAEPFTGRPARSPASSPSNG
ncbi:MAG: hypothetical protein ACREP0_02340 [Rhodanobacteraceae bacterium]